MNRNNQQQSVLDTARMFQLLAHQQRLQVARYVFAKNSRTCAPELAEHIGVPHHTLEQHLELLETHAVINRVPYGTKSCYEPARTVQARQVQYLLGNVQ
jgi:predicted transcriptional regulator